MKILIIALFATKSCGPTEVIKKIVPILINKGHRVDIFSPYPMDEAKEQLAKSMGMHYYYSDNILFHKKALLNIIPNIEHYDIVHMHGIYEHRNWFIARLLIKMNIPYVYSTHGNLMKYSLKKSRIKKIVALFFFIKTVLKKAKCIHVLSENERNDVNCIVQSNTCCIPNGIDIANNKKKTSYCRNVNKKLHLLFIGRIDIFHKGIDILISGINALSSDDRKRINLTIAGPYESRKDKRYLEKKLCNDVKYIGPIYGNDKKRLIMTCDFFVHISRFEGMPIAVLEAISLGIPCIVSRETNMEEIIKKSNAGFVIDCNEKEFTKLLVNILGKKETLNNSINFDWIVHELSWHNIVNKYIAMYEVSLKNVEVNNRENKSADACNSYR